MSRLTRSGWLASLLTALFTLGATSLGIAQQDAAPADERPSPWRTAIYCIKKVGDEATRVMLAPSSFSGSPDVSRDGKLIALDGWQNHKGEQVSDSKVYVVDLADPKKIQNLGPGAMPSWSLDGKWLAISHYGPLRGVSLMSSDGSQQELIDQGGWSAEWSPKDNLIAYTTFNNGANLAVYNPETKAKSFLFNDRTIRSVTWGFSWSPDGKRICALVRDGTGTELVIVHAEGEQRERRVISKHVDREKWTGIDSPVAWGGDGKHVIFYATEKGTGLRRLHLLDIQGDKPSKLLPGQPEGVHCLQPYWHPNGSIYFVVEFPPQVESS